MLKAMSSLLLLTSLIVAALLAVECLGENSRDSDELVKRDTLSKIQKDRYIMSIYKFAMLSIKLAHAGIVISKEEKIGVKIQQRVDETVGFDRNWNEYVAGFGDVSTNFWIGLETLSKLCKGGVKLRIDLWFTGYGYDGTTGDFLESNDTTGYYVEYQNEHRYAEYSNFYIGSAATDYHLHVSGYQGTIGDALSARHNCQPFSTKDRRNNPQSYCLVTDLTGGWWFNADCSGSNLNGRYVSPSLYIWNQPVNSSSNASVVEEYANRIEMKIWI